MISHLEYAELKLSNFAITLLDFSFDKYSNLAIWNFFDGVNNNKSSIIASQYFMFCKQSKIAFMYDCQINDEIFNPIGIL